MMKKYALLILMLIGFNILYGQEYMVTTTDSTKLYIKVKGTGPYCLVVHGGPGSGSYWLEKFSGSFFEQHFTMVYLDQRGTGRSSSPEKKDYSLERIVKDFEEVRMSLKIDEWLTLGHSFGGILQMAYIERYPNVIKGMMMFNCTLNIDDSYENGWFKKTKELLNSEESNFLEDNALSNHEKLMIAADKLNRKNIRWKIFFSDQKNDHIMGKTFGEIPNFNNDFGNTNLSPEYMENFMPKTSEVNVPVLFFYGKADWSIGPEHYKGIQFPDMILWGSDVGHTPFLENKEDMEKAVRSFITKWSFN